MNLLLSNFRKMYCGSPPMKALCKTHVTAVHMFSQSNLLSVYLSVTDLLSNRLRLQNSNTSLKLGSYVLNLSPHKFNFEISHMDLILPSSFLHSFLHLSSCFPLLQTRLCRYRAWTKEHTCLCVTYWSVSNTSSMHGKQLCAFADINRCSSSSITKLRKLSSRFRLFKKSFHWNFCT